MRPYVVLVMGTALLAGCGEDTIRGQLVGFKNAEFTNPTHPDLQITGTVTGTNTIDFKADAYALRFSGTTEAGGARMTGSLFDCVNVCRSYGEILVKR
jgi:hypothetical protein